MGRHLTPEVLAELSRLDAPARESVEELVLHLTEQCSHCRQVAQESPVAPAGSETPTGALEIPSQTITSETPLLLRWQVVARHELAELLALAPEERRLRIHRAFRRFRNPLLADLLCDHSRILASGDPFGAYELAECAHAVALRLSHPEVGSAIALTVLARANAYRANALRAAGHFKEAEALLNSAWVLFEEQGSGDPLAQAELLELSASLFREQRRLVEAEGCLAVAEVLYERAGQRNLSGRVLIQKARIQAARDELDRAAQTAERALALLDSEADGWLCLCARHNLAEYLVGLGRFAAARLQLDNARDHYARFPDELTQLRRGWLEGRIQLGCGDAVSAEQTLARVREGFLAAGLSFDSACVGLDLALVFLETGQGSAVKHLAEQMLPVFMAQDIRREAAAVLLLFQEAVRSDSLTARLVLELAASMRRLPSRHCELPS